jgi:hypothetical protein
MLEGWLEYHRATVLLTCDGLTGEQRQRRPVATSLLSMHGMVRHLAEVERNWFQRVLGQEPGLPGIFVTDEAVNGDWGPLDGADWAGDLATWQAAGSGWGVRASNPSRFSWPSLSGDGTTVSTPVRPLFSKSRVAAPFTSGAIEMIGLSVAVVTASPVRSVPLASR